MYSLNKIIESTGELVSKRVFNREQNDKFQDDFNRIWEKQRDPRLNVAVIGEFSSGKSTLINTLIHKNLLKTGFMVTTAAPAYLFNGKEDYLYIQAALAEREGYFIRITETAGKTAVEVYKEMGEGLYKSLSKDGRSWIECNEHLLFPEKMEDILAYITTKEEAVKKIEKIEIFLPRNSLPGNMVIIDTPGVNPGKKESSEHEMRTRKILEETADTVLVLFPADAVYTQTFEDFLNKNAARFMDHAVLMITMMDRVQEDEREEIIGFAREKIKNKFQIKDPFLLSCSAGRAEKDEYWRNMFQKAEKQLMDNLKENRERILAERTAGLLDKLLEEMNKIADIRMNEIIQKESRIQKASVPNLSRTLNSSYKERAWKIRAVENQFRGSLADDKAAMRLQAVAKVKAELAKRKKRLDITKYVQNENGLNVAVTESSQGMIGRAEYYCDLARKKTLEMEKEMDEILVKYYGTIGAAAKSGDDEHHAASDASVISSLIGTAITDVRKQENKNANSWDKWTAGIGIGLGLIVGGPLLAVGGLFLGLVGGDSLFVESSRTKVLDSFTRALPGIADKIESMLVENVNSAITAEIDRLASYKNLLEKKYQSVYDQIIRSIESQKAEVMRERGEKEEIREEIRKLKLNLEQWRQSS